MELLVVVAIVAVIGVSATLAFSNIETDTSEEELKNKYVEIQRAANLYMDLHNADLEWFIENKEIYYKIATLKGENYITSDLDNPVTGETIDGNYFVKIYIKEDEEVNSCIVEQVLGGTDKCIADHLGNYENLGTSCCN